MADRAANLAFAALFASPVVVARVLRPSAEGVGTHQQLGLPPCTFLWATGFPCPFCGMTTSWAHAARFDVIGSIRTQPMGFVLFAVAVGLALLLLLRAAKGTPRFDPQRFLSSIPSNAWWGSLAALLLAWAYKTALVLASA